MPVATRGTGLKLPPPNRKDVREQFQVEQPLGALNNEPIGTPQ
jgi:hypothetical protein